MLATFHTSIVGWSVFFAAIVTLVAWLLMKVVTNVPWFDLIICFGVYLVLFTLAVRW